MKEKYSILNENGSLSSIGEFDSFDDADDFLNSNSMLAFYVFSKESEISFRQSVGVIANECGEVTGDEYFILNENNKLEYIGEYNDFNEADQSLIDNDREDDSFFIFDQTSYENLIESL